MLQPGQVLVAKCAQQLQCCFGRESYSWQLNEVCDDVSGLKGWKVSLALYCLTKASFAQGE